MSNLIAAGSAIVVAVITVAKFFHNRLAFTKQHHFEKKARLLDLARRSKNKYPNTREDIGLLRHAIYDYCDQRSTCIKLFIICLNTPEPEEAVESYQKAGHLYYFCAINRVIIRKSGNKVIDIIKSILIFIYYATSIGSLWFLIFFKPNAMTLENNTQIYAYSILLLTLTVGTVHSFYELGKAGKKHKSIQHIRKIQKNITTNKLN
ncbi:hypothetical protein NH395_12585 [Halomonas sp. Mc5H-6]|nr:hypothetical protein [Halomonas sp. Mc5H-6]